MRKVVYPVLLLAGAYTGSYWTLGPAAARTALEVGRWLFLIWCLALFVRWAPRAVSLTLAAAAVLVVVAWKIAYPSYEIRYRVTLTIEANGVRITESAVWEDRWASGPGWVMLRSGTSWGSARSGDSLVFDLPDGRQFVMRRGSLLIPRIAFGDSSKVESLRDELARLRSLPVGTRGSLPLEQLDKRPILLPSSDSPAGFRRFSIFEKNDTGIRYVSGFVEITDRPITRHIEQRLKWFSEWSLTAPEWDSSSTSLARRELRS